MSAAVDALLWQLRCAGLPTPVQEHRFHPTRGWLLDLAWPDLWLAAEIDGAVFAEGRHTRGVGFTEDCEKCDAAALLGWTILRFTTRHAAIKHGYALAMIEACIQKRQGVPFHDPTPPPRSARRRH